MSRQDNTDYTEVSSWMAKYTRQCHSVETVIPSVFSVLPKSYLIYLTGS